MRFLLALAPLALLAAPAPAREPLDSQVHAILSEAGSGTRWGLLVLDADGREVAAIDSDKRFIPASNTKIYTSAAAMRAMASEGLPAAGARVRLVRAGDALDVVLEGRGDPHLSSAADCTRDCLATLADAVAAQTRRVRDVVGDDTLFPDERWSPGMSWNNIPSRYGTGISALTIDDNEIAVVVTPGAAGAAPSVALPAYYSVQNHARTIPGSANTLAVDRAPNGRIVVLTGTIGAGAAPATLRMGIDDPADFAAWRLAQMLRARGVQVSGQAMARHRPLMPADDPGVRGGTPPVRVPAQAALAELTPPPLGETLHTVNKVSQNLYTELLLRRLALANGTGSIADGQVVIADMLADAGVPAGAVALSDGSGMSTYNRVTPRGTATLVRWIASQPWGAAWRATLPVGGKDGTLARRFAGTALDGRIFAKTGTINATNALAGYMTAASGRELTFAIYANDVPADVGATAFMDRALLSIAAAN
ncbi:D-alanyl-D-alanine carboxypeptidase/D-alanyl-D-alanine-endopeptidase [Altererythrobacter aerius]|uniref:D-alanyl-D-alanine carboxypeptidase/D-alanyl-D-alanine-endopeptidase n=2 Tax=Tsuneonella aeria TaxID=1837929 RepID=A0A6I4TJ10_9SPHN|nr:D-alanyl-D-alanine carboxypeptidase/D-alanyl-D-alanine-endopeptidase [Tsuneonella aeria]